MEHYPAQPLLTHGEITPMHVALMMDWLKTSRILNTIDHEDSWIDKAAVFQLGRGIRGRRDDDASISKMYLMFAEKEDNNVETSEYEMVCWVNDPSNMIEVQSAANEVIQDHIEEAEKEVLFGTCDCHDRGTRSFKHWLQKPKIADPELINEVIEIVRVNGGNKTLTVPPPPKPNRRIGAHIRQVRLGHALL